MLNKNLIGFLTLAVFTTYARADSLAYVVTDTDQFGTVDLTTGAFRQIGADTPQTQFNLVAGPNGSLLSLTASGNLESINTKTGATTVIGATGLGFNVGDLAEVGGTLYATDGNNNLYTLNATTGAAHLIGPTGLGPIVFNPPTLSDESLYGVGGKLYATFDTFNLPLSHPVLITPPALYEINTSNGVATEVGSTLLNISASVDVNGTFYGFKEGVANPACVGPAPVPCASDAELFTLNLANGDTSFVTAVDLTATAIYGAAPDVPEPTSIALAGIGLTAMAILSFRKRGLASSLGK